MKKSTKTTKSMQDKSAQSKSYEETEDCGKGKRSSCCAKAKSSKR